MAKKMAVRNYKPKNTQKMSVSFLPSKKSVIRVFSVFAVVGLIVGAINYFPRQWPTVMPVKSIVFNGQANHIDKVIIEKLLNNNGGMFSIDLTILRQSILDIDWIKDVEIRKEWPETLIFTFEEFAPIAKINQQFLLNSGDLVENNTQQIFSNLMAIKLSELANVQAQDLPLLVNQLKDIRNSLSDFKFDIEHFVIDERGSWSIQIKDKFLLTIGRRNQKARIERFLNVYVAIENKEQLETVDLRYDNGLAVKLLNINKKLKQNG